MTDRLPCAILGASGYIGQHFVRLLSDHPWFDLAAVTASERKVGERLDSVWLLPEELAARPRTMVLQTNSPARLARTGIRAAFSALPSHIAGPVEGECRRRGIAVFSNAAAHRREPGVPLVVPEVNRVHLRIARPRGPASAPIVTNPNCTTTGLVLALKPVLSLLGPRNVYVATYQALSGAGFPGVASLSVVDNVVPFIAEEEEKVAAESRWILGEPSGTRVRPSAVSVFAQCVRVPVRDGHLEAVTVVARRRPTLRALLRAWETFDPLVHDGLPTAPHPPIELRSEVDRPQPLRDRWAGRPERARGMAAVIGRVRWDPPILRFFVLSHNAVRGGAGGSVLNAELAVRAGLIGSPRPTEEP